jgi:hypothetical protein
MTVAEMHYALQNGLQRQGSYAYDDFQGEEIDFNLNLAQRKWVKQRADVSLEDPFGFEQTQKRLDDLRVLFETRTFDKIVTTFGNNPTPEITATEPNPETELLESSTNYQITLPDDYLRLLRVQALVKADSSCGDATASPAPIRVVRNNQLSFMMAHPFNTTKEDSPLATMNDRLLTVQTDGVFKIVNIEIEYIREPVEISNPASWTNEAGEGAEETPSELPSEVHPEIVDLAVRYMSATAETSNYQQLTMEQKANE